MSSRGDFKITTKYTSLLPDCFCLELLNRRCILSAMKAILSLLSISLISSSATASSTSCVELYGTQIESAFEAGMILAKLNDMREVAAATKDKKQLKSIRQAMKQTIDFQTSATAVVKKDCLVKDKIEIEGKSLSCKRAHFQVTRRVLNAGAAVGIAKLKGMKLNESTSVRNDQKIEDINKLNAEISSQTKQINQLANDLFSTCINQIVTLDI